MCKALSVDDAVEKIKGPAKINEVIPEVAKEDRSKVFNELRMEKATALQKQAQPMAGAATGMEMRPSAVQTSAQTAMAKADLPDDFYTKLFEEMAPPKKEEPKQSAAEQKPATEQKPAQQSSPAEETSLESMFSPAMKQLKRDGQFKEIAQMALDFAGNHESKGDLESAKKYYKIAQKYFDQHIQEKSPGISAQGAKPTASEIEVARKLSPEAARAQQAQAKEAQRTKNLPTSFGTSPRSPITQALFGEDNPKFLRDKRGIHAQKETEKPQHRDGNPWEQLKAPENNPSAADAINRFKALRSQVQQKFAGQADRSNLTAEGDSPKTSGDIVGQALTDAVSPANVPEARALALMDAEHERNRPRSQKEKESIEQLQAQKQKQLITTERQIKQEGGSNPAPGQSVRSMHASGYISPQTQQEHQQWLSARTGAQTGQGLSQEDLKRLQGTSTEATGSQQKPERPSKSGGRPIIAAGDAKALEARLASESARKQAAMAEKQARAAAGPKELPSANESMVVSARKSMEKSAEQAKKPALPKKPKDGAVAGEIPESDIIGDYSERMESQKSINDKPPAKQGFGSAEKLKKARALLNKK